MFLALTFIFAAILVACAYGLISLLPEKYRVRVFMIAFTLMLTPSWGPATIVLVPVPFGLLLLLSLYSGSVLGLLEMLRLAWLWYLFAFPITTLAGLYIGRRAFGGSTFNVQST